MVHEQRQIPEMDGGWFSLVDSRERYVPFICDLGDLMDHTFLL